MERMLKPLTMEQRQNLSRLALRQEKEAAEKRLAVAIHLLKAATPLVGCWMPESDIPDRNDWADRVTNFLTHQPGEWVVVKREDLEWAQDFTPEHWSDGRPNEYYNRIQVALGKKPVGEWQPKSALKEPSK